MRTSDAELLFVPEGLGPPPADHWQRRWQGRLSTARHVVPSGEDRTSRSDRIEALRTAVADAVLPVVLIAHGDGALVVAEAAPGLPPGRVKGAFLVAPPVTAADMAASALPTAPLPFPSVLVASRTDPAAELAASEDLGHAWGSAFVDAGDAGRLDAASGHGPWPEGLMRLAAFLSKL